MKTQVTPPILDLENLDIEALKGREDQTLVNDVYYPHVTAVTIHDTLGDVVRLMVDESVHAVVVLNDDETLAGVISQTDMVLSRQQGTAEEVAKIPATQIMTPEPMTITKQENIQRAITMMTSRKIHRLVVVEDKDGKDVPVGICAMTDIIRHMFGYGPRKGLGR